MVFKPINMWHSKPKSMMKTHKGWIININKAPKHTTSLKVTISPQISVNEEYVQTLPKDVREKIYKSIFDPPAHLCHSFIVEPLYPLIEPWAEATNKAYKYINDKLGQFDIIEALHLILQ